MRYGKGIGLVGVFLLSATFTVKADVWDTSATSDNTATATRNHLVHASDQVHDLAAQGGVADQDWFLLRNTPYSSFQAVIDGNSVDVNNAILTRRDAADPATIVQGSFAIDGGVSRTLLWQNTTNSTENQFILVDGAATSCTTTCTAAATYHIRLFDTTYLVPRFNNANGQVTVLLLQNSTGGTVPWTANYWSVAGALLTQVPGTLTPRQTAVVNLSTIPALQNQTGAITITHLGGYGGLAVKSVALEPATGFSFDTPGTYRSR
jgi:hypothetical protein